MRRKKYLNAGWIKQGIINSNYILFADMFATCLIRFGRRQIEAAPGIKAGVLGHMEKKDGEETN